MATENAKIGAVTALIRDAIDYRDALATDRKKAREYFDGKTDIIKFDEGRSRAVSMDVREALKKVLPSMVRTILGNEKVVEYQPTKEQGDAQAEQASDFVNLVVLNECGGFRAIQDAIHDALLVRNGILRWFVDERKTVKVSTHTGLDEMQLAELVSGDDVEVLAHTANPDGSHDVKIKRVTALREVKAEAVPPEEWLIHSDATDIETATLCGIHRCYTRADLIAMGYDRERINELAEAGEDDDEDDERRPSKVETSEAGESERSLQEVDYYCVFVRIDADGDDIPELRRMVFIGGTNESNLFEDDYWDEAPFADLASERRPHQWEGRSLADDLMSIQDVKTVLIRQTLDNLYWQNNPQPVVQEGAIANTKAVVNPQFGEPIRIRAGTDVRAAYGFQPVPFVAKESFAMLDYWSKEVTDRTGISDASSGMEPGALQNMTAKATALIETAGIAQTELMVRNIAEGLRRFFKGLLKIIIQHQDRPRTVRLRGKWETFNPRSWDADMDATVNVGMGAGTRERDMMMMQMVIGLQEKLLVSMGPDNPFVKPENLYSAVVGMTAAAGIKTPSMFFTKPDPQEVEAKMQAMKNRPTPEQQKAQAQIQIEQVKAQNAAQMKQLDVQVQRDKEAAQMQADLQVKMAELDKDAAKEAQRISFEREKLAHDAQMKREELALKRDLELLKLNATANEDGSFTSAEGQRNEVFTTSLEHLAMMIKDAADRAALPRRVVRDPQTGDVIGVETLAPEAMQ